jgi:hypothetical protein
VFRPRTASQDEYAALELRITRMLTETDAVERAQVADRCYVDVLAGEAARALTRDQRDQLLTLLQSVVEQPDDES